MPSGWLVETNEVGIAAQREGEEHALLLPARESAEQPLLQTLQPSDGQQLIQRSRLGVVTAEELQMFANPQRFRHAAHLQHGAQAHAAGPVPWVAAEDFHLARIGFAQSQQQAHGCRFAGPIGPQQSHDFSRMQLEREAIEGDLPAKLLGDLAQRGDRGTILFFRIALRLY